MEAEKKEKEAVSRSPPPLLLLPSLRDTDNHRRELLRETRGVHYPDGSQWLWEDYSLPLLQRAHPQLLWW